MLRFLRDHELLKTGYFFTQFPGTRCSARRSRDSRVSRRLWNSFCCDAIASASNRSGRSIAWIDFDQRLIIITFCYEPCLRSKQIREPFLQLRQRSLHLYILKRDEFLTSLNRLTLPDVDVLNDTTLEMLYGFPASVRADDARCHRRT